jgi:predicted nucleic acid-binding protein
MKRIFVDTGAWYALVDKKDPDHSAAASFLKKNKVPLLTTNFIFDEIVTLIRRRFGSSIAGDFGRQLKDSRLTSLVAVQWENEERAWELFLKFKDQDFSYTDCTSFAVMKALKIDTAFTFDRHFLTMNFKVFPKIA